MEWKQVNDVNRNSCTEPSDSGTGLNNSRITPPIKKILTERFYERGVDPENVEKVFAAFDRSGIDLNDAEIQTPLVRTSPSFTLVKPHDDSWALLRALLKINDAETFVTSLSPDKVLDKVPEGTCFVGEPETYGPNAKFLPYKGDSYLLKETIIPVLFKKCGKVVIDDTTLEIGEGTQVLFEPKDGQLRVFIPKDESEFTESFELRKIHRKWSRLGSSGNVD